jgi:hypothetical protein
MGQAIPSQHPAVVLRSTYRHLQALLATALVIVIGLSVAVVILANDEENGITTAATAQPIQSIEYGNFNPQTGRPLANVATPDVAAPDVAKPDESKVAAAIWRAQQARDQSGPGGPDESSVAASIAGH